MSDNGLPKATMANYIKNHTSDKRKVSAQFIQRLLDLSKCILMFELEFIDCVSAKANEICEREGKKTINNQHFFLALKEMGMGSVINSLVKTDETLKMKQQKKQEQKMRVQQTINKRRSEIQEERQDKQMVPLIESQSHFKPIEIEDDQEDFVQILENEGDDEVQIIEEQRRN